MIGHNVTVTVRTYIRIWFKFCSIQRSIKAHCAMRRTVMKTANSQIAGATVYVYLNIFKVLCHVKLFFFKYIYIRWFTHHGPCVEGAVFDLAKTNGLCQFLDLPTRFPDVDNHNAFYSGILLTSHPEQ